MNAFYPKEQVSIQLLSSIPRKVSTWINYLGPAAIDLEFSGNLIWNLNNDNPTIIIMDIKSDTKIQIWWTGSALSPAFICGSEEWMENINEHLDKFVGLEKLIYDELDKLEAFIELTNPKTHKKK